MAAQYDDSGFPVITETGIRCGNGGRYNRHYHANADTVKACYAESERESFEIAQEVAAEKRATRFYEEGF